MSHSQIWPFPVANTASGQCVQLSTTMSISHQQMIKQLNVFGTLQGGKAYQHQEGPAAGLILPVCWLHCLQLPILPTCSSAWWPHLHIRLVYLGITAGTMMTEIIWPTGVSGSSLLSQSTALQNSLFGITKICLWSNGGQSATTAAFTNKSYHVYLFLGS